MCTHSKSSSLASLVCCLGRQWAVGVCRVVRGAVMLLEGGSASALPTASIPSHFVVARLLILHFDYATFCRFASGFVGVRLPTLLLQSQPPRRHGQCTILLRWHVVTSALADVPRRVGDRVLGCCGHMCKKYTCFTVYPPYL